MLNKTLITTSKQNYPGKNFIFLNNWLTNNYFLEVKKKDKLSYHWDSLIKKKKDHKYLSNFYEKVLKDLSNKLNLIHNVNYNLIYWRVILGPWLYTFISSNYDRWEILSKTLSNKKFFFNYHSYKTEKFINLDFKDYYDKLTNSDNYNYKKFDEILKFRNEKNLNIINKIDSIKVNGNKPIYLQKLNYIIFIFQKIYFNFSVYRNKNIFFTSFFKKRNIPSFISEFGKRCNFFIFFSFKNFIQKKDYNNKIRNQKLTFRSKNLFETFIKNKLFKELPISYLEKYKFLRSSIFDKYKNKFNIITTVEHLEDDVIKIWLAEKIFYKSKLYIYDHSNSLRLLLNDFGHEKIISKKIISCFKNNDKSFINLPDLKFSFLGNKKTKTFNNAEFGSIILYEGPKYAGKLISAPTGPTNNVQFNQIINFYSKLKKKIKKKIIFKSPPYSNTRVNTQKKIKTLYGKKSVFDSGENLKKIIDLSKVIVCTYPQTTLLEIILSKKPFIVLYPKNFWEFDNNSQKLINKLRKKNILFFDENKASKHLNKYWDNLELWWNSKDIQLFLKDIMKNHFNFKEHNHQWGNFFKKL